MTFDLCVFEKQNRFVWMQRSIWENLLGACVFPLIVDFLMGGTEPVLSQYSLWVSAFVFTAVTLPMFLGNVWQVEALREGKAQWKVTMCIVSSGIAGLYMATRDWVSGPGRTEVLRSVPASSPEGQYGAPMYTLHLTWTMLEILRDAEHLNRARKDFWLMVIHHPMTLALVWGSYVKGYIHVGTDIMFLCHVTDAVLYAGLSLLQFKTKWIEYTGTGLFIANLGTWAWFRGYRMWAADLFSPISMAAIRGGGVPGFCLMGFLWILLGLNIIWYIWMWERLLSALRKGARGSSKDANV